VQPGAGGRGSGRGAKRRARGAWTRRSPAATVDLGAPPAVLRAYPGRDVRAGRSWDRPGGHETVPS